MRSPRNPEPGTRNPLFSFPAILITCLAMLPLPAAALSGRVVDADGKPIAGARVFVEPGLIGALMETAASSDGAWRFDKDPTDTPVGVFAVAEGFAFGGATVLDPTASDVTLRLERASTISGIVTDAKKHPIKGARVTRIGLLGATKVGIPLAKMKSLGFDEPISGDDGRFTVTRLPEGGSVALKVAHPDYAQEAVDALAVGATDVNVVLYSGILAEGDVLLRDGQVPLADAPVIIRNARPPHDTAVTKTNALGAFALRLKPGVYLFQATTPALRSPGWRQLTISGAEPLPRIKIYVAGVGRIQGKVCDAVSGKPILGAKITLDTQGNIAAAARTGPTGDFTLSAMAGENVVRLESAAGYQAPEQPALRVQVVEDKDLTLPTFWLAPIPSCTVEVVDANMTPVAGAVVTVLRPLQFGWNMTDATGKVLLHFGSLPPDGTVIGMVEHSSQPLGALFALKREDAGKAKVQLFALAKVNGRVVNAKGEPVEGAVVGGLFGEEGLALWRTTTNQDGAFTWSSVIPQVPQQVMVSLGEKTSDTATSLVVDVAGSKDLGDLIAPDGPPGVSVRGKPLAWYDHRVLSGELPDRKARKDVPALLIYCSSADATITLEGMKCVREIFVGKGLLFAVVVDGVFTPTATPFPVLAGKAPGVATTYLLGTDGTVQIETFGLPPLEALQQILPH